MRTISSMTGFGSAETEAGSIGRISVELRSTNHKFLETVFHLPEGLLSIEDKIKKEIESRIKRGRVSCCVNIKIREAEGIFVNRKLLKKYIAELKEIREEFNIENGLTLENLLKLPGVLSLKDNRPEGALLWGCLKTLLTKALGELSRTRLKEGRALAGFLRNRNEILKKDLKMVKARFRKAVRSRLKKITAEEERSSFLKAADISEEMDRLSFHIRNFQQKIAKGGRVGKELDFITQEMQREANTLAAKSFDAAICGRAVQMKSQIEKLREQVQNIE